MFLSKITKSTSSQNPLIGNVWNFIGRLPSYVALKFVQTESIFTLGSEKLAKI